MSKKLQIKKINQNLNDMKLKILFTLLTVLSALFSCDPEPDLKDCSDNPIENVGWIKELIKKETDSTYNDSIYISNGLEIVQYNYKEQTVFLVEDCIKNCSDGLAIVYDCEQNVLCEFGGIAGLNTCPDFEANATNKKILFSTRDNVISEECDKKTIISNSLYKELEASPIIAAKVKGNCLNITFSLLITQDSIQDVTLVAKEQILLSDPAQYALKFNLKENLTKPISITATTSFDISNLPVGNETILLRIEGYDKPIKYTPQPKCGDPNVNCINDQQQKELKILNKMLSEIQKTAVSIPCKNPEEWDFTAVGSKACGGPTGYIAYSTKINVSNFLTKVKEHKLAEKKYNIKWGVNSDCNAIPEPSGINCNNGKAELIY